MISMRRVTKNRVSYNKESNYTRCSRIWMQYVPESGYNMLQNLVTICSRIWLQYAPESGYNMFQNLVTICSRTQTLVRVCPSIMNLATVCPPYNIYFLCLRKWLEDVYVGTPCIMYRENNGWLVIYCEFS